MNKLKVGNLVEIYIDGDACPVKDECFRVAGRHHLKTFVVTNSYLRLPQTPMIELVVVSDGFDAADDWIADNISTNDIAITSDIPLASRCLKAGAHVFGPGGKAFTTDGIGMALAMRELNAHLRDTGEIRGGGPAFSNKDRSQFLNQLENAIQKALRVET